MPGIRESPDTRGGVQATCTWGLEKATTLSGGVSLPILGGMGRGGSRRRGCTPPGPPPPRVKGPAGGLAWGVGAVRKENSVRRRSLIRMWLCRSLWWLRGVCCRQEGGKDTWTLHGGDSHGMKSAIGGNNCNPAVPRGIDDGVRRKKEKGLCVLNGGPTPGGVKMAWRGIGGGGGSNVPGAGSKAG